MNKTLITLAVAGILTGTAATATQAAEAFSFSLGDVLQISVVNAGPRDHEDRGPAWHNPPPAPGHRREAVQPPPPKHRHKTSRHQTARNDRHAAPAGHGDKGVQPPPAPGKAPAPVPARPQEPAKPQAPAKAPAPAKPQPPAQPRH